MVPNGSPYARDKNDLRLSIAVARVTESGLPLVYLNQIGGQDELVFDGASFALNADLSVAAQLPAFEENITTLRWTQGRRRLALLRAGGAAASKATRAITPPACWACAITSARTDFPACCSASPAASIRRCARRSRSMRSAPSSVRGVMLPFRFTAQMSLDDAAKLAKALGFRYEVLPIADAVQRL